MVIGINRLGDTKVYAALAHGFQISIKTSILCKEKADNLSGSITNGAMKGIFDVVAKPFVRRGIELNELVGMWFAFSPVGAVTNFFLFGAFCRYFCE